LGFFLEKYSDYISNIVESGVMFFLFRSEFFFQTTRELEYLVFLSNLTLGYMTKTLNQIIFFPPPKSEFFLEKNDNPNAKQKTITLPSPFQVKWSVPYIEQHRILHKSVVKT
jgi:hypothetical protein